MAKGKAQELNIEEKLAQALVPEEEQPYEVPRNWVWTRLGDIIGLISGRDVPTSLCNDQNIGIPYILGASNLEDNNFLVERWIEEPVVVSVAGDILLSVKGTIGKIYLQQEPKINISRQIMALRPFSTLDKLLLMYYLEHIEGSLKEAGNGLIPGISREDILKKEFPLPPLTEQQRIVDRIENLFAKLDQAKELAQNALDTFEPRKASILHKAFTGELSAKWREQHSVGMDSWEKKPIKAFISELNQGWSPKCESYPSESFDKWGVIKTTAIQHMNFDENENKQLPEHLEARKQHELKEGDILITRAGPRIRVGVCCLVKNVRPLLLLCDKAYRFRALPEKVLPNFLVMQLNTSTILDEINRMKTGISDSGVNLTQDGFLGIEINVPSIPEQQEIVRILDNLFEKEQKAKELVNIVDKIDLMKKVILARAFRGELGTNDPTDENAIEVLKECIR